MTDHADQTPREKKKRRGGSARGTKPIRRTIPGYGILKVASGARTPKEYEAIDEAILAVGRAGRFDWLRAIDPKFKGNRKPVELVQLLRTYAPARLPDPNTKPLTMEIVDEWLARWGVSQDHKEGTRQHLQAICKLTNSVHDLPRVLREEQKRLLGEKKPYQFLTRRKAVLAYLRNEVGVRHDVTNDVVDIKAPTKAELEKNARPHNPHNVAQSLVLMDRLGPGFAEWWATMFLTGARPSEVWGTRESGRGFSIDLETGHLQIHGGKTKTSKRLVPLLKLVGPDGRVWKPMLTKPEIAYDKFEDRLRNITDSRTTARDGRRSYATWTRRTGLDYGLWRTYMGHHLDQTMHYAAQGLVVELNASAKLLNGWLEGQEKYLGDLPMPEPLYDRAIGDDD